MKHFVTSLLRRRWAKPWLLVVFVIAVPIAVAPWLGLFLVLEAPLIALAAAVLTFRSSRADQKPLWECVADAVIVSFLFTVSSTLVGSMLGGSVANLLGHGDNFH